MVMISYRVAELISPDSESGNLGAPSLASSRGAYSCFSNMLARIRIIRLVVESSPAWSGGQCVDRCF